jgi:hypothetical protein
LNNVALISNGLKQSFYFCNKLHRRNTQPTKPSQGGKEGGGYFSLQMGIERGGRIRRKCS